MTPEGPLQIHCSCQNRSGREFCSGGTGSGSPATWVFISLYIFSGNAFGGRPWCRTPRLSLLPAPCVLRGHPGTNRRLACSLTLQIPWRPSTSHGTGLPPSGGHTTILMVVDRFLKAAHFVLLPKLPSAAKTEDLLVQHIFHILGFLKDIVSDRGPQSASRVWRAFCAVLGVTVSLFSGYHLQSNVQMERTNETLENTL